MDNVVYIDILFITNALIGYFILRAALRLCDESSSVPHLILGACLAGFASFVILISFAWNALLWLLKLSFAIVICAITLKAPRPRRLIKLTIWYIVLNVLLAGLAFLIMYYFNPKGIIISNLTLYFNISPLLLLACVLLMYIIIKVLTLLFTKPQEQFFVNITFVCAGVCISCRALVDSGFKVSDSLLGTEPFLVSLAALKTRLPPKLLGGLDAFYGKKDSAFVSYIYPVCIHTAAGEQALPCVKVNDFAVHTNSKSSPVSNCAAMFTSEILGDGSFDAIIGMRLAKGVM